MANPNWKGSINVDFYEYREDLRLGVFYREHIQQIEGILNCPGDTTGDEICIDCLPAEETSTEMSHPDTCHIAKQGRSAHNSSVSLLDQPWKTSLIPSFACSFPV